jgi:hypothetical protein
MLGHSLLKLIKIRVLLATVPILTATVFAGSYPEVEIANSELHVRLPLPDAANGFYRGIRFDPSGAILSLRFRGHAFYGPWFDSVDPTVGDFTYRDGKIVAGPNSAMSGPVEEFQRPIGFDDAKPGDTFLKVGVGLLRRTDDQRYSFQKQYEIVDRGTWKVDHNNDSITFTQKLGTPGSAWAYVYTKTIRLTKDKPEMVISHSLRNVGTAPVATNVYDHNFLVLDGKAPGPQYTIAVPYEIHPTREPPADSVHIVGKEATYMKTLTGQDRVAFGLEGFGATASDYDFRIYDSKAGVAVRIQGDRPLSNASVWSIRTVLAVEPFIDVKADPGGEFTWTYTYTWSSYSAAAQ